MALSLQVFLQAGEAGLGQRVLAARMELYAGAKHHRNILLVELVKPGLGFCLKDLDHLRVTGKTCERPNTSGHNWAFCVTDAVYFSCH